MRTQVLRIGCYLFLAFLLFCDVLGQAAAQTLLPPVAIAPPAGSVLHARLGPPAVDKIADGADAAREAGGDGAFPIDLATALRLTNAANPTIAVARERAQQAYYRQRRAEVMWLPDLQGGASYNRHDGLLQTSRGDVVSVSKWNFFDGGGAALRLETGDAYFVPLVTRQLTRASVADARAVRDNVQLDVVVTYFDLVEAYGRLAVNREALGNALEMANVAEKAQIAGTGKTPADAQRARAEVQARIVERQELEARAAQVAARLAELLLLPPTIDLRPDISGLAPMEIIPLPAALDELVRLGLANRPEVAGSQALIGAADARWRQARLAPLFPRLETYYSAGSFRGGLTQNTQDIGGRGDGGVQAIWELKNLGLGNIAEARLNRSFYDEATYHLRGVEARVGAEVSSAAKIALASERSFRQAEKGVKEALDMWRILKLASFGLGGRDKRFDPLEPLIAEQQLANARTQLLAAVIRYNKAQFALYTALGQPAECALPAITLPAAAPTIPAIPTGPLPRALPK
ncbi:MAG: TolC family protein [Gemmataceae bacterium]